MLNLCYNFNFLNSRKTKNILDYFLIISWPFYKDTLEIQDKYQVFFFLKLKIEDLIYLEVTVIEVVLENFIN